MLKKYLYMYAGFFLLTILYLLTLLPLILVHNNIESKYLWIGIGIWCLGFLLSLIPFLNIIIKKAWFFPGIGEPVVHSLLHSLLQEINDYNSPLLVRKTRKKLIFSWRINEKKWQDELQEKDIRKLYELHLSYNKNTKTVALSDRFRSVKWNYFSKKYKTGWIAFPKPVFKIQNENQGGIEVLRENDSPAANFIPEELKTAVLNTIIKNGWNVHFTIF